MIRAETDSHWLLITHPDHARLAGQFADAWGNELFPQPHPFEAVQYAVYHHDDGWLARDANPSLTPAGIPEAFTRDLVGAYSAFEEIDLPNYLKVRGDATAAVAEQDSAAGILVSMHTVNLLTEQADLDTIQPEHREPHRSFVQGQRDWQQSEQTKLGLADDFLQRGFEFLQACDNLSLIACSGYDEPRVLRHTHPDRDGTRHEIHCIPVDHHTWKLDPWPFGADTLEFELPVRMIEKSAFSDQVSYQEAFAATSPDSVKIRLIRA